MKVTFSRYHAILFSRCHERHSAFLCSCSKLKKAIQIKKVLLYKEFILAVKSTLGPMVYSFNVIINRHRWTLSMLNSCRGINYCYKEAQKKTYSNSSEWIRLSWRFFLNLFFIFSTLPYFLSFSSPVLPLFIFFECFFIFMTIPSTRSPYPLALTILLSILCVSASMLIPPTTYLPSSISPPFPPFISKHGRCQTQRAAQPG